MQHGLMYKICLLCMILLLHSITLYICGLSLDGMNQEPNNVTSTEYQNIIQVVMMSLNLCMYFEAVCHRKV